MRGFLDLFENGTIVKQYYVRRLMRGPPVLPIQKERENIKITPFV